MRISEVVLEALADWGTDWIHFSKHPMLTINPKQTHSDPAGIYFFPASVNPDSEMWRVMPYKFTASIRPGAHILDVSQVTPEQIWQMIDAAEQDPRDVATTRSGDPLRIKDTFTAYIQQYPPKDNIKMFDMAWEQLQRHYWFGLMPKSRQYASFNGMLRRLGWQAIFDDTGSIHSAEHQLLVLDPRIITNVRMEQRSQTGGAYAAMQKVVKDLEQFGQAYGNVEVTPVQKPNSETYYSDRDNLLMSTVQITNPQNPEHNYVWFFVSIQPNYPDRINVSIRYASPSLGYGSGTEYSISKQAYTRDGDIEKFGRDLDKIFAPQQQVAVAPQQAAMAETRKVPGPHLVGSGKDFRQDAGTNRSGKQPGRLVGSGKAMKVKPGFVG